MARSGKPGEAPVICLEVFDLTSHAEFSFLFFFRPEEFPKDYMSKAWLLASRAVQRQ